MSASVRRSVYGAASILFLNLANATVQTLVRDELRGRVMGIYSLTFFGLVPIGSLIIGQLANSIGAVQVNHGPQRPSKLNTRARS